MGIDGSPVSFFMILTVGFLLSLSVENVFITRNVEKMPLVKEQKKVIFVFIGLLLLLLINAPIKPYWNGLGFSESAILLGAGLIFFMPPFNILEWMEDKDRIPYRIMFLFGAGFSIAAAFSKIGLAGEIANDILKITTLSPILLILAVAVLITFMTEITSNTALVSILRLSAPHMLLCYPSPRRQML